MKRISQLLAAIKKQRNDAGTYVMARLARMGSHQGTTQREGLIYL